MDSPERYRRAGTPDAAAITATIASAFETDPLWSWAMSLPDGSTAHHESLWAGFIDGALRYPETWMTPGAESVAVWIPPGGSEMSQEQEVRQADLAHQYLGDPAARYLAVFDDFEAAHPHDRPHFYLSLFATHTLHRGAGIGMALLRHSLTFIDAVSMPAYLESTNPRNNARYQSVGFVPLGEFAPPGGPVVTTMWREPEPNVS